MRSELENTWFHILVHSLQQAQDLIERGLQPVIAEWWEITKDSSEVEVLEVDRDAFVGHPTTTQLLFAPPGVVVTGGIVQSGDVGKCAVVSRIVSVGLSFDIDELIHPKVEATFKAKLKSAVVSVWP